MQVAFYAIGDGAIERCLNSVEAAKASCARNDKAHRIVHCQVGAPDLYARMLDKIPNGRAFERRKVFGREKNLIDLPDLVEVQRNSYEWFFQTDVENRASQGLQELFDEVFPIESYDGSFALEFVRYFVDPVPISLDEARSRDLTWPKRICLTSPTALRSTWC